jgi:hypothetical protein
MNVPSQTRRGRYFFHLCKDEEIIRDEVGVEVSEFDRLHEAFVQIIREMELTKSELRGWEVQGVDEGGTVAATFRLGALQN